MNAQPTGITLATKVTILRIIGIPVFIALLVYYLDGLAQGRDLAILRHGALGLFLAIALTDALDGFLARSRNEITQLGKILDPLADKALLISGLIMLTRPSLRELEPHIPIWFTVLAISRDVILVCGALVIRHLAGSLTVHPRWTGKLATVLQMAAILWVLTQSGAQYFAWLVYAAGFFTAIAGLQYIRDGVRQVEHIPH